MNPVRVCKKFYLATLAVSQKMVYNVHQKKDSISITTKSYGRGKHGKQYLASHANKEVIISHINSFPIVDAHNCRAKPNKKYFQADLNIG